MTETGIAIIGAGAAGHSAATTLRQEGYQGSITVVHADHQGPYNRTLVNKAVLQGLLTPEQIALPTLDGLGINVVADRAVALDADRRAVRLDQGGGLTYGAVIIATGAKPRQTVVHTEGLRGRVFTIHTTEDATRIRDRLSTGTPEQISVTILGAGFIGAETASYLTDIGVNVDLVSRDITPLTGAVGQDIGQSITELHHKHVRTHFGREIIKVSGNSHTVTVLLDDQTTLTSEIVIVAHGTVPSTDWIGNPTGGGIVVDDRLRAETIEHGYAAGAVAVHRSLAGVGYRIDHWDAAAAQGAHAARAFLHDHYDAPDPGPYVPTTGFALQLYRTSIAAFGALLPHSRQESTDLEPAGSHTTAFFSDDGRMHAIAGINAGRTLHSMRSNLNRP
ncbi:FAD-dependent oxidoreductase [Arthrobacter sp. TB 26]|uniref:FAD-dependent oxidoreductase n=1 Tax=Arthrobacter sp. TB 26 TaxID=494420 RepID=UPI0003FD764A|nr:NAD(P)/FAD-dependent oxidoreductase [Arthrobacter sp. TB 26]